MRFINNKHLVALAFVLLCWIGWLYYQNIQFKKKDVFNFLLFKTQKNQIEAVYLIIHYPDKNYFHTYFLADEWNISHHNKPKSMYQKGSRKITKAVERLLDTKIDYVLKIDDKNVLRLLGYLGGGRFFNAIVPHFPQGELIINHKNYLDFTAALPKDNSVYKKENIYSIWLNVIYQNANQLKAFRQINKIRANYYSTLRSNLSRKRFNYFFDNFMEKIDVLYINKSQMNIEQVNHNGFSFAFPLQGGSYDRKKYHKIVDDFRNEKPSNEKFPIEIQIYNTTPINRLASKISGVLRLKKCNTLEYLNTKIALKRSIILDRSGSSIKRKYFSKITHVSNIYYSFDYREKFDFSLYIGEDYYAIPYVLKTK